MTLQRPLIFSLDLKEHEQYKIRGGLTDRERKGMGLYIVILRIMLNLKLIAFNLNSSEYKPIILSPIEWILSGKPR